MGARGRERAAGNRLLGGLARRGIARMLSLSQWRVRRACVPPTPHGKMCVKRHAVTDEGCTSKMCVRLHTVAGG